MNMDAERGNIPEEFDGILECNSLLLCCAFNRLGTLLAGGCNDGKVLIWDFLTRCEVREIQAHSFTVTSISWSRDGRWLVTTSIDNTLAVWDVFPVSEDRKPQDQKPQDKKPKAPPKLLVRWPIKFPIMRAQFHPKDKNLILVCPYKHAPILIKINGDDGRVRYKVISTDKDDDTESNIAASFDRQGFYIYTGNARGYLTIIKAPTDLPDDESKHDEHPFRVISSFKIQRAAIRDIEFALKNDKYFLVNSTDRTLRLYRCDNALNVGIDGICIEEQRFQDTINRSLWKKCCLSGGKEVDYVCGGSASKHELYIWPIEGGVVKKIFQPPNKGEALMDVQWHPTKPIVVSVSNGQIFIWARAEVENWSAYAPAFEELDENQEYEEGESEFDIEDADLEELKKLKKENEENKSKNATHIDDSELIDITSIDYNGIDDHNSEDDDCDSKVYDLIPLSFADVERNLGHTQ